MTKLFGRLMATAFIVAASAPAFAKTETIRGRVIDRDCYANDQVGNAGLDHHKPATSNDTGGKGCAVECARKGQPMAVLTADGKIFTIVGGLAANNNAKLIPHLNHMVEITGDTATATNFDSKTDLTASKSTISASDLKMLDK